MSPVDPEGLSYLTPPAPDAMEQFVGESNGLEGAVLPPAGEATQESVSLRQRLGNALGITACLNILRAAKVDLSESDNKGRTLSSGAAVLGVQAVGFSRLPFVLAPHVAIGVLQSTGSATEAGAATAVLFGAWCFTVAETLNNGMSHFPGGVKAAGDSFPSFVKHFSRSLPGLEAVDEPEDTRRLTLARTFGKSALTHVRRGLTAVGIGIVPYIGTAGMTDQPKSTIRKLGRSLSVDGGAVVGLISGGAAELILKVGHDHPELAQHIQDDANNAKLLYGVAAGLMIAEWLKNKHTDRQTANQTEPTEV